MGLGDYLARKTCYHIKEKVGGQLSRFSGNMFEVNGNNEFRVWGNYRVGFEDNGSYIRIRLEGESEEKVTGLRGKLSGLKILKNYRSVVRKVSVESAENVLYVDLSMSMRENTQRRVQNKDKLFNAVYHVGVKPVLKAIYELAT